jgi:hypothetical protein
MKRKSIAAVMAATALASGTGIALASASTSAPAASSTIYPYCVTFGPSGGVGATGNYVLYNWDRVACPSGTYGISGVAGPTGPAGPAGPAGPTGPAGPAATTVGTNSEDFTSSSTTTNTFTVQIPPGTHIVDTTTATDLTHPAAVITVSSVDKVTGSVVLAYASGVLSGDIIQITYNYSF